MLLLIHGGEQRIQILPGIDLRHPIGFELPFTAFLVTGPFQGQPIAQRENSKGMARDRCPSTQLPLLARAGLEGAGPLRLGPLMWIGGSLKVLSSVRL
jgi:hypothetical protein